VERLILKFPLILKKHQSEQQEVSKLTEYTSLLLLPLLPLFFSYKREPATSKTEMSIFCPPAFFSLPLKFRLSMAMMAEYYPLNKCDLF